MHRSLASVAALDPVVGPTADLPLVGIAELGHRGTIGAQTIGGDLVRRSIELQALVHGPKSLFSCALFS